MAEKRWPRESIAAFEKWGKEFEAERVRVFRECNERLRKTIEGFSKRKRRKSARSV